MTPAEHLAEAERLAGMIDSAGGDWAAPESIALGLAALAHAAIAVAAETGVPHQTSTSGELPDGYGSRTESQYPGHTYPRATHGHCPG